MVYLIGECAKILVILLPIEHFREHYLNNITKNIFLFIRV